MPVEVVWVALAFFVAVALLSIICIQEDYSKSCFLVSSLMIMILGIWVSGSACQELKVARKSTAFISLIQVEKDISNQVFSYTNIDGIAVIKTVPSVFNGTINENHHMIIITEYKKLYSGIYWCEDHSTKTKFELAQPVEKQ